MRMKNAQAIILIMMISAAAAGEISEQEIYSEFRLANEAFGQGNLASADAEAAQRHYTEAVLHYEKIIAAGGVKNAKLYYNLGNAYLLKNDIGRAILNYLRAVKLEPANGDIRKNLDFARSRRVDKVQIKTQRRVLQTLFFWHYDLSVKVRLVLGCLFFGLLFVGLTVVVWRGKRAGIVPGCVIMGILVICFGGSVAAERVFTAQQVCGVIVAESVVARQGDGANYPESFKKPLHGGTEFDLIKDRPGWLHILLADGSDGWVPDTSAELL